jgi:hypothetical protein
LVIIQFNSKMDGAYNLYETGSCICFICKLEGSKIGQTLGILLLTALKTGDGTLANFLNIRQVLTLDLYVNYI